MYFLNLSGELIIGMQTDTVLTELSIVEKTIRHLGETSTKDMADGIRKLNDVLDSFADAVLLVYLEAPQRWNQAKLLLFACLFGVLIGTALLALLYSHKIAGPLFRIRTCIDMLAEGKDPQHVRLRKNDEFKELAESLEILRMILKNRGFLQSEK